MLLSGINRTTDTVFLEILSYEDLVKTGENIDRLFLVVTYAVAFDRVYYPLPLELKKESTFQKDSKIIQDIYDQDKNDEYNVSRDRLIKNDIHYVRKQEESFLLQEENEKLKKELKNTRQELTIIHDRLKLISKDMASTNQNLINKSHRGLKNAIEDLNVIY